MGSSAVYTAKGEQVAGQMQPGGSLIHSPAHALQGLCEDLRGHAMLMLQDQTLLQGHRHGGTVLRTLAAGESDPIKAATDLSSLPEDVHVLILSRMDILSQKPQQLWKAGLTPRSR